MRIENSYRIIPCYTADVSGVCSALFELGGMVVMHDPSGCNSTYNTHDETRWYNHDSLIYITALTEHDAIMGNDNKAVQDIVDAARRLVPNFIALCGSPIPYLNGTDYKALARIIEARTGISCFAIETNGMHDYIQGASPALLEYAKHVLKPQWDAAIKHHCKPAADRLNAEQENIPPDADALTSSGKAHSAVAVAAAATAGKRSATANVSAPSCSTKVNILGATPLDFAAMGSMDSLTAVLNGRGFSIQSVFSMLGSDKPDTLSDAVFADVNLVISAAGYKLAQYMFKEYGIPYVIGTPVGRFTDKLCEDLRHTAEGHAFSTNKTLSFSKPDASSIRRPAVSASDSELAIIGEPVTSGSIAAAIAAQYNINVSVLCPLEGCDIFLTANDYSFKGEKQCTELMKRYKHIIADPLYLPICPDSVSFHRLPHAAFSGRCCMNEMRNLITLLNERQYEKNR